MEDRGILKELYDWLETKILEPEHSDEVYRYIENLLSESENESEKQILSWELYVFGFMIQDGKILPLYSSTQQDGTKWGYPDYSAFTEAAYIYLKSRVTMLKSHYLRARYNHVLWQSPQKNQNFAREAIDAYIEIIESEKTQKVESDDYEWRIVSFIENVFPLVFELNYKVDFI